jgi:hypothetical protein
LPSYLSERPAYTLNNPLKYIDPTGHTYFPGTATLTPIDPADANGEDGWYLVTITIEGMDPVSIRIRNTDDDFDQIKVAILALQQLEEQYNKDIENLTGAQRQAKQSLIAAYISLGLAVLGLLSAVVGNPPPAAVALAVIGVIFAVIFFGLAVYHGVISTSSARWRIARTAHYAGQILYGNADWEGLYRTVVSPRL